MPPKHRVMIPPKGRGANVQEVEKEKKQKISDALVADDPTRIRFRVEKTEVDKGDMIESEKKRLGKWMWWMVVEKGRFSVVCRSVSTTNKLWRQKAGIDWILSKIEADTEEVYQKNSDLGSGDESDDERCRVEFYPSRDKFMFYNARGCSDYDALVFETHLKLKEERDSPTVDMMTPSIFFDFAVKCGEKKIYVSRQFLALHSSYFCTLFFGDFKEANQEEIELKDVDPEEFLELLLVLYKMDRTISINNVESMLKLADKFDVKSVVAECKACLLSLVDEEKTSVLLQLADAYNLMELKTSCMARLQSVTEIRLIRDSDDYHNISINTREVINARLMEIAERLDKTLYKDHTLYRNNSR